MERAEAKKLGLVRYKTGRVCSLGHVDERYVVSGRCLSCHRTIDKKHRTKYLKSVNYKPMQKYNKIRKKNLRMATPPWITKRHFSKLIAERDRLILKTGKLYHLDHVIPIRGENVCGLHVPWNVRIVKASVNIDKGIKIID